MQHAIDPTQLFEQLISGVLSCQYGTTREFITPELCAALRERLLENYEQGWMKPAGVGKNEAYEHDKQVRGDVIYWLEKSHNAAEKAFLEHIEAFIDYLNQTCYTGINAYEFHYARYDTGRFYKRHKDQFRNDSGRKFSLIVYLNSAWGAADAGQLALYPDNQLVEIMPEGGRTVFFRADEVEHEVKPANQPRLSIAGWLKRV